MVFYWVMLRRSVSTRALPFQMEMELFPRPKYDVI